MYVLFSSSPFSLSSLFFFFFVCLQVLLCGLYCHVLVECDFSLLPRQTIEFRGTDHQYTDTLCISSLFATVSLIWLLLVDLVYFLSHGNNRGGGNGGGGGVHDMISVVTNVCKGV